MKGKRFAFGLVFVGMLAGAGVTTSLAGDAPASKSDSSAKAADPAYVLGFTMNRIDGTPEPLSTYEGKVILIVNVASQCGLTKQYAALEKLYKDNKDKGFVILGFPANNFLGQEPGTNEEIAKFCTSRFSVDFPMFAKISVLGDDQHPLYKRLTSQPPPVGGDVAWNFQKYLVDRNGKVVAMYDPKVTPDDSALQQKVQDLLSKK